MMTNEDYITEYIESRGLKQKTRQQLHYVLNHYSQFNNMSLSELIQEADDEEEQGIRWKRRTLKTRLTKYMNHCKSSMTLSSAQTYVSKVKGFYNHHEIEIGKLPRWNTKNAILNPPIFPEDLPTKEIIRQACDISNPLMKAMILSLVSSGMAKADLLALTVQDFLTSTYETHQKDTIQEAIPLILKDPNIISVLESRRHKTNKYFITFLTPEATHEICNYLTIRDKRNHKYHRPLIQPEDRLFKISNTTYGDKFVEINNALKLGKKGTYNRFRGHMLRKYHATQLEKQGISREHIRIFQGKSNNKVDEAYFYTDIETLRKEYIKGMQALLIYSEVKTVDNYSDEYIELKKQNEILMKKVKEINGLWSELNDIKKRQEVWDNLDK